VARATIAEAKTLVAQKAIAVVTIVVVIEAATAVVIADAAVSDAAADAGAGAAATAKVPLRAADAICHHRSTLRLRAINAEMIRRAAAIRAATAIAITAATTAIREAVVSTIGAANSATTIAVPKVARVRRLHRNPAAPKKKFCSRANRSRSIALVPRQQRLRLQLPNMKRTMSRNQTSTKTFHVALVRNPMFLAALRLCPAGC
jgi:hypothetical protein